ncbi:MAG: LD-carboxypeptidase, partial [Planctomycetota bacterium]
NESPYRVDRMLRTLKDAGKFDDVAGVLLGRFTKAEPDEDDGHTIDNVIDDYFGHAGFPVIAHFPAGHVPDNATLPLGVPAEMDADAITLRILESPTVSP